MPKEKTKKAKDLLNPPGPWEKTAEEIEELWSEIIRSWNPIDQEREDQEKWKMWKTPICPDDNRDMWQNQYTPNDPMKEVADYIWPNKKQKKQKSY